MVFLTEAWFWRGTQSAIFYYASCTPWSDYRYARKRKKEAARSRKDQLGDEIYMQPGVVRQPAPFQTNEEWAQEIVQGPGPPKGWKKDELWHKHRKDKPEDWEERRGRKRATTTTTTTSTSSPTTLEWTTANSSASTAVAQLAPTITFESCNTPRYVDSHDSAGSCRIGGDSLHVVDRSDGVALAPEECSSRSHMTPDSGVTTWTEHMEQVQSAASRPNATSGSAKSSFESAATSEPGLAAPRPSTEKRLSNAMDGFKETLRTALHPDQWNWIRYDRDDEILPDLNVKVKSMWDSVKLNVNTLSEETAARLRQVEMRERAVESDVNEWQRGTHPAVNDLHPPVVSQLPHNRTEAKWMLMPPPSADVMMGRRRPDPFDDFKRQPLCVVGRRMSSEDTKDEAEQPAVSSDEGTDSSEEENWLPDWTYMQKPERVRLKPQRTHSVPSGL